MSRVWQVSNKRKAFNAGFGLIQKVINRGTIHFYKFQGQFWSPKKLQWEVYPFHINSYVCLIKINTHMWVRAETHSSTCFISASPVGFHLSIRLSKQITSPKIMDEASQKRIVRTDTRRKKNIQHTSLQMKENPPSPAGFVAGDVRVCHTRVQGRTINTGAKTTVKRCFFVRACVLHHFCKRDDSIVLEKFKFSTC